MKPKLYRVNLRFNTNGHYRNSNRRCRVELNIDVNDTTLRAEYVVISGQLVDSRWLSKEDAERAYSQLQ